jgi:hypothetical protein
LSPGGGVPACYLETDFSRYRACGPCNPLLVDCRSACPQSTGCSECPFRTVTAAYQAALAGDTLRLFACNYCETLTLSTPLRLEATNGLVNIGCQ